MRMPTSFLAVPLLLLAADASANTTYYYPGNSCQPLLSDPNLEQDVAGAENTDLTLAAKALCPVGGGNSSTVDVEAATVRFFDGNNNASSASVWCKIELTNLVGSASVSSTLYSCGTNGGAGGCATDSDPTFSAIGTLTWADPFSSMAVTNYTILCNLPRVDVSQSIIYAYNVTHVNP